MSFRNWYCHSQPINAVDFWLCGLFFSCVLWYCGLPLCMSLVDNNVKYRPPNTQNGNQILTFTGELWKGQQYYQKGFSTELNILGSPTRTLSEWQRVSIQHLKYKAGINKKLVNSRENNQEIGADPSQKFPFTLLTIAYSSCLFLQKLDFNLFLLCLFLYFQINFMVFPINSK